MHPAASFPALLPRPASVLETSREHPVVLCVLTFWHSNHGEEKKKKKPDVSLNCAAHSQAPTHMVDIYRYFTFIIGSLAVLLYLQSFREKLFVALCSHDVLFDSTIPEWRFGITQALCASKFTTARPPACPPVGPLQPPQLLPTSASSPPACTCRLTDDSPARPQRWHKQTYYNDSDMI